MLYQIAHFGSGSDVIDFEVKHTINHNDISVLCSIHYVKIYLFIFLGKTIVSTLGSILTFMSNMKKLIETFRISYVEHIK